MIELINGINFHNFMLDSKSKSWFKKGREDLVGFELDLKGSYDWKLSDIKKLELILNKKLL